MSDRDCIIQVERAVRMLAHRNTAALISHLVNYKDQDDEDQPLVKRNCKTI